MIDFDEELHVYSDGGIVIPSVTQVLKKAGLIDDRFYNAEARDRGSAVHALCERYANGERVDSINRPLDGLEYVNAFSRWMHDRKAYPLNLESVVSHTINGNRYAGKFDGIYQIDGRRVLIDVKTGCKSKWHKIQLAAYSMASMIDGKKVNPDRCTALYLTANGKYKDECFTGFELLQAVSDFKDALAK